MTRAMFRRSEARRRTLAVARLSGVVCVCVAVGCASAHKPKPNGLTPQERASLGSVSVSPKVAGADRVAYVTREAKVLGSTFGLVGAVGSLASAAGSSNDLKAMLRRNDIDVADMLLEEFRSKLPAARAFPRIADPGAAASRADAEFKLELLTFGLSGQTKRKGLRPNVVVRARLVRGPGEILWEENSAGFADTPNLSSYGYNDYKRDPAALQAGFQLAVSGAVAGLIANLR